MDDIVFRVNLIGGPFDGTPKLTMTLVDGATDPPEQMMAARCPGRGQCGMTVGADAIPCERNGRPHVGLWQPEETFGLDLKFCVYIRVQVDEIERTVDYVHGDVDVGAYLNSGREVVLYG